MTDSLMFPFISAWLLREGHGGEVVEERKKETHRRVARLLYVSPVTSCQRVPPRRCQAFVVKNGTGEQGAR